MGRMRAMIFFIGLVLGLSSCAGTTPRSLDANLAVGAGQVEVRLDGATEPETLEIFGRIVGSAPGVTEARRISTSLVPDDPQASSSVWVLTAPDIDVFTLQTGITDRAKALIAAKGRMTSGGVDYNYSAYEARGLLGLRAGSSHGRLLRFVIDRELARDREMSGW